MFSKLTKCFHSFQNNDSIVATKREKRQNSPSKSNLIDDKGDHDQKEIIDKAYKVMEENWENEEAKRNPKLVC